MKGDIFDMEDYKPNSHKYKSEQKQTEARPVKKIEKVVKGDVKVKKKSEISKLKDIFISEDASNVKTYVVMDVLVPALKKAVSDIITNGIDIILYGETDRSSRRSAASSISYRQYYDDRRSYDRPYRERGRASVYSYNDIVIPTRGEAEDVLDGLYGLIDRYQVASVADFYDLVGVTGEFTDNNYGWTVLTGSSIDRVSDGYIIRLPKARPINR